MSTVSLLVGLLALVIGNVCAYDDNIYKGDGTAYSGAYDKDATGFNSCGFGRLDDTWERYYAARPSQVFDRSEDCGKCIKARGLNDDAPGTWVKVMVVDECASCDGDGDLDFSSDALKAITGYAWDRKPIEWQWTSCDDDDSSSSSDGSSDSDDNSSDSGKRQRSLRRMLRA